LEGQKDKKAKIMERWSAGKMGKWVKDLFFVQIQYSMIPSFQYSNGNGDAAF